MVECEALLSCGVCEQKAPLQRRVWGQAGADWKQLEVVMAGQEGVLHGKFAAAGLRLLLQHLRGRRRIHPCSQKNQRQGASNRPCRLWPRLHKWVPVLERPSGVLTLMQNCPGVSTCIMSLCSHYRLASTTGMGCQMGMP